MLRGKLAETCDSDDGTVSTGGTSSTGDNTVCESRWGVGAQAEINTHTYNVPKRIFKVTRCRFAIPAIVVSPSRLATFTKGYAAHHAWY